MAIDIEAPGDDEAALRAAIQALRRPLSGVVCYHTGWAAADYTSNVQLSFNSATHLGTDTWWVIGSPTIITIPAGVARVDIDFQIYSSDGTSFNQNWTTIRRNGSQAAGPTYGIGQYSLLGAAGNLASARNTYMDVPVSPGDTFGLDYLSGDASQTLHSNLTYFRIVATEFT